MPPNSPDDRLVDRWIQRSLRERWGATLGEPVPEALSKLLQPEPTGK